MLRRRSPSPLTLLLAGALACGDGKTTSASDSDASSSDATSSDATTTGAATDASTTAATTTDASTTAPTTDASATDTDPTTGGDITGFERFKMDVAAGPCPPNSDCDGFIELLASRTLRVEPFGEVGNPVLEAEVSEEDFVAAALVFADPELTALLDGPDPVCDPPTDIFEAMLVEIDGASHDASTTFCDQPAVAAARDRANALAMKYFP